MSDIVLSLDILQGLRPGGAFQTAGLGVDPALPRSPVDNAPVAAGVVPTIARAPIATPATPVGTSPAAPTRTSPAPPVTPTLPAPAAPAGVPSSPGGSDNIFRQGTVDYWKSQGLPQHVAEGIADALEPESSYNPSAYNPNDNGAPSGGLYQHHAERFARLQQYAKSLGRSWTDPSIQHQFANLERQQGNPYTEPTVAQHWNEIANAPDRATATALWQKYFERGVLQGGAGVGAGVGGTGPGAELSRAAETVRDTYLNASTNANERARALMGKIDNLEKDIPGSLGRIRQARDLADQAMRRATEATGQQPHPPEIDGIQKMGSLATIVGMLGGLLTRSPMTATLNAGASAIEAAKAGDLERYNLAFDSWKTNNDILFKIADLQTRRANDIAGDEKMGFEERRTALDLYLRATGQQQLADELRIKGLDAWYSHQDKMQQFLEKQREFDLRAQELHQRTQMRLEGKKSGTPAPALEYFDNYKREHPNATPEELSAVWKKAHELFPDPKLEQRSHEFDTKEGRYNRQGDEKNAIARQRADQAAERETQRHNEAVERQKAVDDRLGIYRDSVAARQEAEKSRTKLAEDKARLAEQKWQIARHKDEALDNYVTGIEQYKTENNGEEPNDEWKRSLWEQSHAKFPKSDKIKVGTREYDAPKNAEVIGPDGKTIWQGATERDKSGKWVKANSHEDLPPGNVRILPGTSLVVGSRENVLIQRALTAGKEVVSEINNAAMMPVTVSSGVFGGRKQGPSLMDASKEVLTNKVTSQDVQIYNTSVAGMQRELAGLVTGGVYINSHVIDAFNILTLKEGDTYLTKMYKLATFRQNAENGLDPLLVNPRMAQEQKDYVAHQIDAIRRSVPWTPAAVIRLENEQHPKMSLRQYAASIGLDDAQPGDIKVWPTPSQKAIDATKADPSLRQDFENTFGPENTRKALGQ